MDIFEQISGLDMVKWAMEQAPTEYLMWFAVAILAGIAFKFAKEPIHFVVELIARFGNFLWYVTTHAFSARVRERERRELRKQQHELPDNYEPKT